MSASDREVEAARRELAGFAHRDGFLLLRVYVDRIGLPTTGFTALFQALGSGVAGHVVVPPWATSRRSTASGSS
jgi:hypothetical protein